jgi:hypothetical protein
LRLISSRKLIDTYVDVYEEEGYVELPVTEEERIQHRHDIDAFVAMASEIKSGIRGAEGKVANQKILEQERHVFSKQEKRQQKIKWEELQRQLNAADSLSRRTAAEDPFSLISADKKQALLGRNALRFGKRTIASALQLELAPKLLPGSPDFTTTEMKMTFLMNAQYGLAFVQRRIVEGNLIEHRFRLPRVDTELSPVLKGFAYDIHLRSQVRLQQRDRRAVGETLLHAAANGATLVLKTYHFSHCVPSVHDPEDEHAAVLRPGKKKKKWKRQGQASIFDRQRVLAQAPTRGVHVIPDKGIAAFTNRNQNSTSTTSTADTSDKAACAGSEACPPKN